MPSHLEKPLLGFLFRTCCVIAVTALIVFMLPSQARAGSSGISDFAVYATGTVTPIALIPAKGAIARRDRIAWGSLARMGT